MSFGINNNKKKGGGVTCEDIQRGSVAVLMPQESRRREINGKRQRPSFLLTSQVNAPAGRGEVARSSNSPHSSQCFQDPFSPLNCLITLVIIHNSARNFLRYFTEQIKKEKPPPPRAEGFMG